MILNAYQYKTKDQVADDQKVHKNSIDRNLREVREAGLALAFTERDVPLPSLKISNDDGDENHLEGLKRPTNRLSTSSPNKGGDDE